MTIPIDELTDATVDEQIASSPLPLVIDFWAEWCGPCKLLSPALEAIAEEHHNRLRVAKVNVDENPETARRFNAMSVPTLLVFQGGLPVKRLVGARGKSHLVHELTEFLT